MLGSPGSGKSTKCEHLSNKYPEIIHLSIGELFRNEI